MKTTAKRKQETYASLEEYEKNCYFFSPSISKRKTVGGNLLRPQVFQRRQGF